MSAIPLNIISLYSAQAPFVAERRRTNERIASRRRHRRVCGAAKCANERVVLCVQCAQRTTCGSALPGGRIGASVNPAPSTISSTGWCHRNYVFSHMLFIYILGTHFLWISSEYCGHHTSYTIGIGMYRHVRIWLEYSICGDVRRRVMSPSLLRPCCAPRCLWVALTMRIGILAAGHVVEVVDDR